MSGERADLVLAELEDELGAVERQELAAKLALSVEAVDPGPAVREQVMARIAAAPARPARPARSQRPWRAAAALAAAATVGALCGYGLVPPRRVAAPIPETAPPAEDTLAELESLLEEQDEEITAMEAELADARDALSVLVAQRVERLDLGSQALSASARVYWDWDEYSCYFVAEGLPAAEAGRSYALWLYTDEDEVLLAGVFRGSASAQASFFAMLPKEMGHVLRAVVTLEVEPPGEEPSGEVLLAGGSGEPVQETPQG